MSQYRSWRFVRSGHFYGVGLFVLFIVAGCATTVKEYESGATKQYQPSSTTSASSLPYVRDDPFDAIRRYKKFQQDMQDMRGGCWGTGAADWQKHGGSGSFGLP